MRVWKQSYGGEDGKEVEKGSSERKFGGNLEREVERGVWKEKLGRGVWKGSRGGEFGKGVGEGSLRKEMNCFNLYSHINAIFHILLHVLLVRDQCLQFVVFSAEININEEN